MVVMVTRITVVMGVVIKVVMMDIMHMVVEKRPLHMAQAMDRATEPVVVPVAVEAALTLRAHLVSFFFQIFDLKKQNFQFFCFFPP